MKDGEGNRRPGYGLLGFVGNSVLLSAKQEDGATLRDHLLSHWRQEKFDPEKKPELLEEVEYDECLEYLWDYFLDMSKRRTSNGFSYNPITHEGLEAWQRRRGIRFEPFEYEILDAIEVTYLCAHEEIAAEAAQRKQGAK